MKVCRLYQESIMFSFTVEVLLGSWISPATNDAGFASLKNYIMQ